MYAGPLNDYLDLMEPVVAVDGYGSEAVSYRLSCRVHAQAEWRSGKSVSEVGEVFPYVRMKFLIRDAHKVSEDWRVVFQGVQYSVDVIEHSARRGYKRLYCSRVNE